MGDTKKSDPKLAALPTPNSSLIELCDAKLLRAIDALYQQLDTAPQRVAIALSGGVDSAALALHASVWAQQRGIRLLCFHVHHGLQQVADSWLLHVQSLASLLSIPCEVQRVQVDLGQGDGMESAARTARYQAFADMAKRSAVSHVFLAHHQDDQAETVLLRLLRGSGPSGLGAMAPLSQRQELMYLRPWLDVPRSRIKQIGGLMAQHLGWQPVEDVTNHQDDYTRGALRERLTPHLNERWQGWQKVLVRHAQLSRETSQVLTEVAQHDLQSLDWQLSDGSFSLKAWRELSAARQALVLRYWLEQAGLKMPTEARLADLMRQMRQLHALGFDRQMQVKHGDHLIVCARGRVILQRHNETVLTAAQRKSGKSVE